jgi:hypothetical protein
MQGRRPPTAPGMPEPPRSWRWKKEKLGGNHHAVEEAPRELDANAPAAKFLQRASVGPVTFPPPRRPKRV